MTTLTPEEVQAAGLAAALEQQRRELDEEREQIARERAELEQARSRPVEGDDSLVSMLREFHQQHAQNAPKTRMDNPCQHVEGGNVCGLLWRDDMGNISHPKTHSYRPEPMPPIPEAGKYTLTRSERLKAGLADPAEVKPEDLYVSEKQAAQMLGVAVKDVRALVKDGAIKVTVVGDVKLLHRASVARIKAAKEAAAEAGDPDAE